MTYELAKSVAEHRAKRRGEKAARVQDLRRLDAQYALDKEPLLAKINRLRYDLLEAKQEFQERKSLWLQQRERAKQRIEEAAEGEDLPRFTDQHHLLAYYAHREGESVTAIRKALGVASTQEASDIIARGKDLHERNDW